MTWIQHVKDYAKKHDVSYREAMKLAKETYKKGSSFDITKTEKRPGYDAQVVMEIKTDDPKLAEDIKTQIFFNHDKYSWDSIRSGGMKPNQYWLMLKKK